jgi:hypothetical protein
LRRTAEFKDITLPLDAKGELKGDGSGSGTIPISVVRVAIGLIIDLIDPSWPDRLILSLVSSFGMGLRGSMMDDKSVGYALVAF